MNLDVEYVAYTSSMLSEIAIPGSRIGGLVRLDVVNFGGLNFA